MYCVLHSYTILIHSLFCSNILKYIVYNEGSLLIVYNIYDLVIKKYFDMTPVDTPLVDVYIPQPW